MAAAEQVTDLVTERVLTTDILPVLDDTDNAPATILAAFEEKMNASIAAATDGLNVIWHKEDDPFGADSNPCIASFTDDFVVDPNLLRQWFLAALDVSQAAAKLAETTPSDAIHLYLRALRDRKECVVGGILYARFGDLVYIDAEKVDSVLHARANRARDRLCYFSRDRKRSRSPEPNQPNKRKKQ